MENKANQNPQSNQNKSSSGSANQSSMSNQASTSGTSGQSSMSGGSSSQSSMPGSSGQSGQQGNSGKGNLNNLTSKLQQFGSSTMEKVNGLSTTQKVVGGSLLALGAGWVAMNSMNKSKSGMSGKKSGSQHKLNKNLNKGR